MDMGRGWSVRCGRGLGGVLALACLAGCEQAVVHLWARVGSGLGCARQRMDMGKGWAVRCISTGDHEGSTRKEE